MVCAKTRVPSSSALVAERVLPQPPVYRRQQMLLHKAMRTRRTRVAERVLPQPPVYRR